MKLSAWKERKGLYERCGTTKMQRRFNMNSQKSKLSPK